MLRPYGVWAVISPFNFPLALAAGPAGGALVAGNTVVFKPASATPLLGYALYEVMARGRHAGRRLQLRHRRRQHGRPGAHRQRRRRRHRVHRVERSRDAPDSRQRRAARAAAARSSRWAARTRRSSCSSADLDKASDGVMRSAFGAQGQKCSACSRVYVTKPIRDEFVRLLVEKTKKIKIGNPLESRRLHRAGHQRGRGEDVRARGRAGAARRRHDPHRRPAAHRRRVRARLLRRADDHRRPARRRIRCSPRSSSSRSRSSAT